MNNKRGLKACFDIFFLSLEVLQSYNNLVFYCILSCTFLSEPVSLVLKKHCFLIKLNYLFLNLFKFVFFFCQGIK